MTRRTTAIPPMLTLFLGGLMGLAATLAGAAIVWSAGTLVDAPGAIEKLELRMDNVEKLTEKIYPASEARHAHDGIETDMREMRARLRELETQR